MQAGIPGTCRGELERTVEEHIVHRTGGRVHALLVERIGERVIIHGRTARYYIKQLALQAACEVLGSSGTEALDLDIQVGEVSARLRPRFPDLLPLR
jgi:hypothetical protein